MPQVVQTHINALYADLAAAKQNVAVAQGEVEKLEEQIRGRGGEVPGDKASAPKKSKEDVASADDVSAAEVKPKRKRASTAKKGKK